MQLPRGKLARFARELIDQCMVSRVDRANQNTMMTNYALCGGEDSIRTASFNKTYAYLDDLQIAALLAGFAALSHRRRRQPERAGGGQGTRRLDQAAARRATIGNRHADIRRGVVVASQG